METIKDIGKFIAWHWKGLSSTEKVLLPFLLIVVSIFPCVYFFGLIYILFVLGGICLFVIGALTRLVWMMLRGSWDKFQSEQDAERQRVADKLRGHVPEPEHELFNDVLRRQRQAQDILQKLRARNGQ